MNKDILSLEAEARKLSPQDRARLIRRLIATLDAGEDHGAEQLWLDDACSGASLTPSCIHGTAPEYLSLQ